MRRDYIKTRRKELARKTAHFLGGVGFLGNY
jgi:hypothetical protein